MQQRKILFADHTAVLGGAELSLLDLANAYCESSRVLLFTDGLLRVRLQNLGVDVRVVSASPKMLNLRTSGGLNALKTIPELWSLAGQIATEAKNFDLVHANSQKAFVVAALATLRGAPPVVWHLRDILTARHFSSVNRWVAVALANRCATKVIVNSQATGQAFIAAGGNKNLVDVVYNGFNLEKFEQIIDPELQKIRDDLNIGDAPVVGLFSRFSYWKGQHILLSAIKHLPRVHVLLVGDALFGEEEYVSKLKNIVNQPELKDRVHWLGFRDDVPTLMKACDIVVHTSTEPEPFGRVIVEGQLAQRPVIASAAGGALELIEDKVNGCLFTPGDSLELQKLIQQLIDDRDWANTLAKQGYASAKTNFTLESVLKSFERAICDV